MQQIIQNSSKAKRARKKAPKIFIAIKQFYVLHSNWISRSLILLASLAVFAFSFQQRDNISNGMGAFSGLISKQLALIGFGVDEVIISGQSLTNEKQILDALMLDENSSLLTFNATKARKNILELSSVSFVTVRKIFPNKLIIEIKEYTPIALWRISGETFYIDAKGNKLSPAQDEVDNILPLVIGLGAAQNANIIINALNDYPLLNSSLIAYSKIANRRWDLLYDNGLRVQLPETGLREALDRLNQYQAKYKLLDRDINLIDLRIANSLVTRLVNENEDEEVN